MHGIDINGSPVLNELPALVRETCWICGAAADSNEHKYKRTDMAKRYGRNWVPADQPFVFRGDGRRRRIQGLKSRLCLYSRVLCQACNNARTKPFDLAYERFSEWVFSESSTLYGRDEIDFLEVFGNSYLNETPNLLCYFAKSLGCDIANAGIDPPAALRRILMSSGITDTRPFRLTFGINQFWHRVDPSGRVLGKGDLMYWPHAQPGFSWSETIGYLQVYHWYDLVWERFPFGGAPMSAPVRTVSLGRVDYGDPQGDGS